MLKALFIDFYGTVVQENGLTNSDDRFVEEAVRRHGMKPAGIVTSEQARYAKPRKEIFEYALQKTGLRPDEVVHIGDSLKGDVYCPKEAGIRALWLNREKADVPAGVEAVESLAQAGSLLSGLAGGMEVR